MVEPYSFDRAAHIYDATRGYPPDVARRVTQSILDITGATPAMRLFEMGIGTGRISAPLIAAGLHVTGIDLSLPMMSQIRSKVGPQAVLRLAQADAAAFPLAGGVFSAALAVHVFHLIAHWRRAIGELRRVLSPGGLVLHLVHPQTEPPPQAILRQEWRRLVEARGERWQRPGTSDWDAVSAEFQALGASVGQVEIVQVQDTFVPREEIESIAGRVFSETWQVSEPTLLATVAELSQWATARFGSLDAQLSQPHPLAWEVYRFERPPLLPDPIRQALDRLASLLQATGARWALAGSANLALHGISLIPHDIDLSTDREGAYLIGQALRQEAIETQPVAWSEGERIRSHHGLYQLGGVQIDIVGASEFREGGDWSPGDLDWKKDVQAMFIPGTGVPIPAISLEFERQAYQRMGRQAKSDLIAEHIAQLSK